MASSIVCDERSQWIGTHPVCEIIECGQPSDVQNGSYNFTSGIQYGSVAMASCNAGYETKDTANIVCGDDGNWNGSLRDCFPVDCKSAQSIENGTVSFTGTTFKHTATYNCMPGFELVGPNLIKCNQSAQWEPYVPRCQGMFLYSIRK
ncbi:hypothetical protein DPMN_163681 [Dreissena polymorpha]|uniref:Sushi domain-containing protein n=1 Tax=Dreissena polymorpha TaxID=45954 RepID=A0A9D4ETU5_DREPO|nr:hypothetical protein DPMN_163681 [Dreissena polymorpha]